MEAEIFLFPVRTAVRTVGTAKEKAILKPCLARKRFVQFVMEMATGWQATPVRNVMEEAIG
jgi:hypothetical protein